MTGHLTRMFSRPRALCAACQVGQGRQCACRKPSEATAARFWWAYVLLVAAGVAVWRVL